MSRPRHFAKPVQTPGILKKLDPRRRRSRANPDGTMSLVDHLQELRNRLLIAVAAIVVTTTLGFFWYTPRRSSASQPGRLAARAVLLAARVGAGHHRTRRRVPAAGHGAVRPVHAAPQGRADRGRRAGLPGLAASAVGLHHARPVQEGTPVRDRSFVGFGAVLFIGGAVLAYVVLSKALSFLLTVGSDVQITALSGDQYFGFLINLLLVFGISFEFPLLIIMLNMVGMLPYERLKAGGGG